MKLVAKERKGGKIQRRYYVPKTPYQRLLESGQLSARAGKRLQAGYDGLQVAALNRKIEELRKRLFDLVEEKQEKTRPRRRGRPISLVHSRPIGKTAGKSESTIR